MPVTVFIWGGVLSIFGVEGAHFLDFLSSFGENPSISCGLTKKFGIDLGIF